MRLRDPKKRVYITRWGTTQAVVVGEFTIVNDKYAERSKDHYFIGPADWHKTEAEATADVLAKIDKKLAALDKQRAKLEALRARIKSKGLTLRELPPEDAP